MPLNDRQSRAFDTAVPGVGSTRSDSAGSVINKLFTVGPDDGTLSLGTAANGTTAGKLNAVYVTYTTNATANTADSVTHTLGRVPVGYLEVRCSNSGTLYDGGVAFTSSTISLKCTTASNTVTVLIW